ncbi:phage minor head protein [Nocardioides sp. InS609-2]|uniref:phage minor head protein n=1 Tax=Nocardioides sp. InS609-2 TaxID=2760705 RepID=UPI0020C05C20|nr:phage minor head protein [Nocardioides sp. InS609-2]
MAASEETIRLQRQLRISVDAVVADEIRDLTRAWATAWDEIGRDLNTALVDALTAGQVTRAQMLKAERLKKALSTIGTRLEDLSQNAGVRILGDLRGVIDTAGSAQASIIDSQLPRNASQMVDLDAWSRVDPRQVDAIVRRSTQQITSTLRPLSGKAYDVVQRELIRSVASGSNPKVAARRMIQRAEQGFNGGLTRAMVVSRTEIIDAHRTAAAVGQAPHADVLAGWTWVASLTPRTCPACLGKHGEVFPLTEPGPLGHQQCRCSRVPTTKSWADLGFDGITEPPSLIPDADAFFARLSPAEKYDLLGQDRYRAWAGGKYPRSEWAARRTSTGWRDSFVPSKPPATPRMTPSAGPAVPPPGWDMGPILGTVEQQIYQKARPLQVGPDLRTVDQNTANHWHTYVPDTEDRTTALLQYWKPTEDLVKQIAADITASSVRSRATSGKIGTTYRAFEGMRSSGIADGGYSLDDFKTDLTAAAERLLAREVEDVGLVYRGLNLPTRFPIDTDEGRRAAVAVVQLEDWWHVSATTLPDVAKVYARGSGTRVLLRIDGAAGIVLSSMGRMAPSTEILLSGGFDVERYDAVGSVLTIYGRWRP